MTRKLLQTRKALIFAWPPLESTPEVDDDDMEVLEKAFGKNGTGKSETATRTIAKLNVKSGRWLVCLCRERIPNPPTLFFRDEHIVRHPRSSEHHTNCEFQRTADDQTKLVGTYKVRRRKRFRLLKKFSEYGQNHPGIPAQRREGRIRSRSTLAALLSELWVDAGIQNYHTRRRRPDIAEQILSVREQAKGYFIHDEVTVEGVLCTNAEKLESFQKELLERHWPEEVRPQGVFISVVDAINRNSVTAYPSGIVVPVRNRIAIYGELSPDDLDEGEDEDPMLIEDPDLGVRKHYICIGVMGQRVPRAPIEVLSCYLHPSYKLDDMMLVDSGYERITMKQIVSASIGLRQLGINLEVLKPLFDISEEPRRRDGRARPVLIPDFVISAGNTTAVVETLGYKSVDYRTRKSVIIPEMQAALNGAHLACMDFHQEGVDLRGLKRQFRDELDAIFRPYELEEI